MSRAIVIVHDREFCNGCLGNIKVEEYNGKRICEYASALYGEPYGITNEWIKPDWCPLIPLNDFKIVSNEDYDRWTARDKKDGYKKEKENFKKDTNNE